jgi:predicted DsbA family dithiol-disulfide isomerase
MKPFTVEIWSDIVCPWCYIGDSRFAKALAQFPHRDEVKVVRRSFQLDPTTPRTGGGKVLDMLASKYRVSRAQAQQMEQQVAANATSEGLRYSSDRQVANTFDAHRLLHLAAAHGKDEQLTARLFAAHFAEGLNVSDQATLVELASAVGVPADEAREVLESGAYSDEVQADQRRAAMFGISGVPFFALNEQYGVSGGQQPEVLLQALNQAWAAARPLTMVSSPAPAEGCDDGVCATE